MDKGPDERIKQAQKGDRRAFEALLTDHYDLMFRIAFKWCGNRADAQDITQEACIKLAKALDGFRGESAFTSWLYRLVINAAIDWQRRNGREKQMPENMDWASGEASAQDAMETRETLQHVFALPEKEKTALLLVFSEGLSHGEAAAVMKCKESTVSWYIHEARKKLDHLKGKERRHG